MLDNPPRETITSLNNNVYFKKHGEEVAAEDVWYIPTSTVANNCRNYIREIVDNLHLEPNPDKSVIALSIGDPTIYGNLKPPKEATEAVIQAILEGGCNGYAPSVGYEASRQAVADYLSHNGAQYTANDVILCSGCSSAIDLCISVLADANKGHNILMPRPGFPIYRTLAESLGVEVRQYDLIPEKNWEVDLYDLESKIDSNTAAIVVTNPSNPCGSVYSASHLKHVLNLAYRYKVPIIADEIYEQLVFPGNEFVSTAALGIPVPILICGGLAKRFLVPGWRLGWIVIHDPINALPEVRKGLVSLSQRTIGSNTVIQGAIPKILFETPQSFHDDLINTLTENAKIAFEGINNIKGLTPFMPQGAMYMMVKMETENFPQFNTGLDFIQKLMEEQSVFGLPGEAFDLPGYFRIVLTVPGEMMHEACHRIGEFCERYYT